MPSLRTRPGATVSASVAASAASVVASVVASATVAAQQAVGRSFPGINGRCALSNDTTRLNYDLSQRRWIEMLRYFVIYSPRQGPMALVPICDLKNAAMVAPLPMAMTDDRRGTQSV